MLSRKKEVIPYEVFLYVRLGKLAERYRMGVLRNASRLYSVTDKISLDTYERFGIQSTPDTPGFEELSTVNVEKKVNRIVSVSM